MNKLSRLLTLLCCLAAMPARADITTGLVARYPLQDDAANTTVVESIAAANGTLVGGDNTSTLSIAGTGGLSPKALNCDGTLDYVNATDVNEIDGVANASIACCFKFSGQLSAQCALFGKEPGPLVLVTNGNEKIIFFAHNGVGYFSVTSNDALNDGQWHQAVGTYNGATLRLYIDGVLQTATTAMTGSLRSTATLVVIGAVQGGTQKFPGALADARLYNRELPAGDVRELYAYSSFVRQAILITRLSRQRSHFDAYGVHLLCPR